MRVKLAASPQGKALARPARPTPGENSSSSWPANSGTSSTRASAMLCARKFAYETCSSVQPSPCSCLLSAPVSTDQTSKADTSWSPAWQTLVQVQPGLQQCMTKELCIKDRPSPISSTQVGLELTPHVFSTFWHFLHIILLHRVLNLFTTFEQWTHGPLFTHYKMCCLHFLHCFLIKPDRSRPNSPAFPRATNRISCLTYSTLPNY